MCMSIHMYALMHGYICVCAYLFVCVPSRATVLLSQSAVCASAWSDGANLPVAWLLFPHEATVLIGVPACIYTCICSFWKKWFYV